MASPNQSIANLKHARRAVKLRGDLPPEQLIKILDDVVQNTIIAQNVGGERMQQRALREVRQIRKSLLAKQIDISDKNQKKYIGIFSGLADQLDDIDASDKNDMRSGLASNLPSPETLISAVMTANPILGYGLKIVKDLGATAGTRKKRSQENQKKRLKLLEDTQRQLMGQEEVTDDQKDLLEEQKKIMDKGGVTEELLRSINDEITALRKIWDDGQKENTEETKKGNSKLSRLVQVEEEIQKEKALAEQKSGFQRIETQREEDKLSIPDFKGKDDKEGGMGLLGMLGLRSLLGGALAGVAGVLGTLGTIFSGLLAGGGKLLRVAGRVSGIGTIIMAIYDFVDGFFNAGEILGIEEGKVQVGDRIVAGFMSIVNGFIELADWVAEFFGFDLVSDGFTKDLTKKVHSIYQSIVNKVSSAIGYIVDMFSFDVTEFNPEAALYAVKESTRIFFEELINIVPDFVTRTFDEAKKLVEGGFMDYFFGDDEEPSEAAKDAAKKSTTNYSKELNGIADNTDLTMVDLARGSRMDTASQNMSATMSQAERRARTPEQGGGGGANIISAPNTNVNNTTVQGRNNTSNPEESFRMGVGQNRMGFSSN